MRVLIIDDDSATAQSLELMLKSEGFVVDLTDTGEDGLSHARTYDYDAIVLDSQLPDVTGLEVLIHLRQGADQTPVLFLAGADSLALQIGALEKGADDYMSLPFHKDVLVARMRALIRRSKGIAENLITVGPLTVDIDRKVVRVGDKIVPFTGKEYALVEVLALRRGQTVTKEGVMNHLYGGLDEPELKIVDVFICKIRAKLRKAGADGLVETTWGRGYCLKAPVQQQAAA